MLKRRDTELSEKDYWGRHLAYWKVVVVAVVGYQDGAHHLRGVLSQTLHEVANTPSAGLLLESRSNAARRPEGP
jgi:tRNA(His) 5'-end guanylyltransferase